MTFHSHKYYNLVLNWREVQRVWYEVWRKCSRKYFNLRGKSENRRNIWPISPLFVTEFIFGGLGSNPCLCNERTSSNHLRSGRNFFISYSDLFIPTYCRCRGLSCTWLCSRIHTRAHSMTPLGEGSARRREFYPGKTQEPHEKNIHAPSGIRSRNPRKLTAADPRLRTRSHQDRRW